jgi:putative transposase
LAALERTLVTWHPAPSLIRHLDRGDQCAGGDYAALLSWIRVKANMAAVANPYKNARAETFLKTPKLEEVLYPYQIFGVRG